jgi:hypothetical protein
VSLTYLDSFVPRRIRRSFGIALFGVAGLHDAVMVFRKRMFSSGKTLCPAGEACLEEGGKKRFVFCEGSVQWFTGCVLLEGSLILLFLLLSVSRVPLPGLGLHTPVPGICVTYSFGLDYRMMVIITAFTPS